MNSPYEQTTITCPQCQTTVANGLLSCPGCQTLIYSRQLKELNDKAQSALNIKQLTQGLGYYREMMELLPHGSKQFQHVASKIETLSQEIDKHPEFKHEKEKKKIPKSLVSLGVFGLLLWKFKFILVFLATKAKLLVMGLTKAQTFFSMFLAFGVYLTVWGWKFALGLILCIYIHEMGHVFMLNKFGVKASAPTFIPGVGAIVRLKQRFMNPIEDARVGLAGPIWGLGAAVVCYLVFLGTGWGSWGAIAKVGAWINLFNLLPIHPLDGGRGFHALGQKYRWICALSIGVMWFLTHEGLLALLLIVAIFRSITQSKSNEQGDKRTLVEYCLLVITLSALSMIDVPVE